MAIFKISGSTVKKLTTTELGREKHLQKLFEDNLEEILNIIFLYHEHPTSFGGRIDTLGIDKNGPSRLVVGSRRRSGNSGTSRTFPLTRSSDQIDRYYLAV